MSRNRFLQLLEQGKLRLQEAKREHDQREAHIHRAIDDAQMTPERERQITVDPEKRMGRAGL